jgi:4-amino-4-deoxy-L-arabinose transferase-like glycosyltransferase
MALSVSIWGLATFFIWHRQQKIFFLWLSAILLAVGTLCKLPFIAYYMVPFIYFIQQFSKGFKSQDLKQAGVFLCFSLFPIAWYLWVIPTWDSNPIIWGMLDQKDSLWQLLDYIQFNLVSTLPELLLNYGSVPFFIAGFYFLRQRKVFKSKKFTLLLGLSLTVSAYYLFEANAIAKVHDYYLFPFFPILFILVAYGAYHLYHSEKKFWRYFTLFALAILPLTCYLRMHHRWNPESPGFNPDLLKHKTELREAVPNDALVVAGNDISKCIFLYYIDKKGWSFTDGHLSGEELDSLIKKGAEYLYIDSDPLVNHPDIQHHLGEKVSEYGSIEVYHLKD